MSWVDRLQQWVETLPLHYALIYSFMGVLFALLMNLYFWLRGVILFPQLAGTTVPGILWVSAPLILMHLANNLVMPALAEFRGASFSDSEVKQMKEDVVYMPPGWLLLACCLFGANAFVATSLTPEMMEPFLQAGMDQPTLSLLSAISYFVVGGLIFHSLRLLRTIGRLYQETEQITILDSGRTYAFTTVTVVIALGWGALIYATILAVPGILRNPIYSSVTFALGVVILVSVVSLLVRINRRLHKEKSTMRQAVVEGLYAMYGDLEAKYRAGDLEQVASLRQVALAKKEELEFIDRLSTWPWQPGTMAGVVSALLLPAVIVLIQELTRRLIP